MKYVRCKGSAGREPLEIVLIVALVIIAGVAGLKGLTSPTRFEESTPAQKFWAIDKDVTDSLSKAQTSGNITYITVGKTFGEEERIPFVMGVVNRFTKIHDKDLEVIGWKIDDRGNSNYIYGIWFDHRPAR